MRREEVLDLARADVLALADDDVLLPSRDAEEAVSVEDAEVARSEPAVGCERVRAVRGVAIPEEALGTARLHLALAAGRHGCAVVVDEPELRRADRPSVAVDAALGRIVGTGRRDRRK